MITLLWGERSERDGRNSLSTLLGALLPAPNQHLAEQLYAETDGNPLFIVEIARSLSEAGGAQGQAGLPALPATVQAAIYSQTTGFSLRLAR